MNARLWVTGLGLVTPLGASVEATWSRLVLGETAIRPVRLFDTAGQRVGRAAEVADVVVPDTPRGAWSRSSAMALAAAGEAMARSRLDPAAIRTGLVVGGTTGGMLETEQLLALLHAERGSVERLVEMLSHPLTATGDRLEERLGPFSRVRALSSACSSGANAVVVGAIWLLSEEVDAVLVGGCDGLCRLTLSGFNSLGAIDPDTCRPFDRRRCGTSLGEGAGFLVLERAETAIARRAEPIAQLSGWAVGSEAHHITHPAPDGNVMAAVIGRALARARLSASDVDYVNAHGTGTIANDAMEAAALTRALGPEIERVPISSSKGQIGHTLGAAGGIEAAITALVVARRVLVPTAGLDEPDAALRLVHVPRLGFAVPRVRAALSNAFGFGGMGTVLVFTGPGLPSERLCSVNGEGPRAAGPAFLDVPSGGCGSAHAQPAHRAQAEADRSVRHDAPHQIGPVITAVSIAGAAGLLGSQGCMRLPELAPSRSPASIEPDDYLDVDRARRLDRSSKLATIAVEQVLREAAVSAVDMGLVLGSAFGSVDACAAFMHRIVTRGARAASPAEFPNLVPSSPVGHVSIYAGIRGPAFMTADLGASGESAFAQAIQLVRSGEVGRVVACASEPKSDIVERVFAELFDTVVSVAGRKDLAAAIAIESDTEARERNATALARVMQVLEWRGDGAAARRSIRSPHSERPEVIYSHPSHDIDELVSRTHWQTCRRWACSEALGDSDALGAAAVCVAASRLGAGKASEALVVGLARGRGYAIVLAAP